MTTEDVAIIGAIATILAGLGGAVLGALITYKIGTKVSIQNRFNEEAAKFCNAFTELRLNLEFGLDESEDDVVIINELLGKQAYKHLTAIINFKPFLSKYERTCMDNAWDEYCHPDGVPKEKTEKEAFIFDDYYRIQEASGEERAKKVALENLKKILSFGAFK